MYDVVLFTGSTRLTLVPGAIAVAKVGHQLGASWLPVCVSIRVCVSVGILSYRRYQTITKEQSELGIGTVNFERFAGHRIGQ